jgi:cardiolipin synthase (CMP-forming)
MNLSFLPNLLCILRMLLVYPVGLWILEGRYPLVLAAFALAAFTDGLDGFLAKRFDWTTELGKHLDPLADKLLLVTVFVCLSRNGDVSWALTAIVLLRDLVIVFGAIAYRIVFGPVNGTPTIASKVNTLVQILFCLATVASAAYSRPEAWVVTALGGLVVVSTGVSGIGYVLTYSRRAAAVARQSASGVRK